MVNEKVQKMVAALRSGDFKQGLGALKEITNDRVYHCCLGVYIEVNHDGNIDAYRGYHGYSHTELLGPECAEESGMDQTATPQEQEDASEILDQYPQGINYTVDSKSTRQSILSMLNDAADIGFEGIADFIEDHGWDGVDRSGPSVGNDVVARGDVMREIVEGD